MDYDELVQKLRDWSDTHSFSAVPRAAADAITKLRAERDALQLSVAGFDAAREMLNVQDNQIDKLKKERDALRALLREANLWVREFDGDDSDSCLCNRISLALKDNL